MTEKTFLFPVYFIAKATVSEKHLRELAAAHGFDLVKSAIELRRKLNATPKIWQASSFCCKGLIDDIEPLLYFLFGVAFAFGSLLLQKWIGG